MQEERQYRTEKDNKLAGVGPSVPPHTSMDGKRS